MKAALLFLAISITVAGTSGNAATIEQTVQFNGVTPERLYELYLSSAEISAALGAPSVIDAREGGSVSIYDGHITGKIFQLVPGKLIVQSWRARKFTADELDSTLILTFRKNDDGAELDMVQSNVPDEMYAVINSNWNMSYWELMKAYLKTNPQAR